MPACRPNDPMQDSQADGRTIRRIRTRTPCIPAARVKALDLNRAKRLDLQLKVGYMHSQATSLMHYWELRLHVMILREYDQRA
jgi:hypothetical protein